MNEIRIYIFMAILLFGFKTGYGQQTASLTLDESLEMAANNNPELKAAFNQYLAALEKVPQVGALPDPEASFGFFTKPMAIMGGEQVASIQLMQMFPWFGTLKAGKNEATEMAKAKFELFNANKADLFFRIKKDWYQLMKTDREIKLVQEDIEILESLEKLILVKYQSPSTGGSSAKTSGGDSMNSSSKGNMNTSGAGMTGMNSMQNTVKLNTPGSMSGGNRMQAMSIGQTNLPMYSV